MCDLQDGPTDWSSAFLWEGFTGVARAGPPTPQGRNIKFLTLALAITTLMSPGFAFAQAGNMMNGAWMGGYGGAWVPILLVVLVGLVAWVVMQKRK